MVCESMGEITYGDKGNMTRDEIDKTMAVLTEAKKAGQFRAFWKTFDESVNLMASGEVVIQSMWSPAVTAVKTKGIPCVFQPLEEGYRIWGGGIGLSKNLSGLELDAAYEYINWVSRRLGRRLPDASGLLFGRAFDVQGVHERERMELLVRGQARHRHHHQPLRRTPWPRRARPAMAAPSTSVWATSHTGTPSWTKTSTWFASGTSSSRPDHFLPISSTVTTVLSCLPGDFPSGQAPICKSPERLHRHVETRSHHARRKDQLAAGHADHGGARLLSGVADPDHRRR